MLREDLRIPLEKLSFVCSPGDFTFKSTSELEPLGKWVGQEKALEAIRFGLEIVSPGYNIFATGNADKRALRDFLGKRVMEVSAKRKKADSGWPHLRDICFVYNFDDPNQPKVLFFDQGGGKKFKKQMEKALEDLRAKILRKLTSKEFGAEASKLGAKFDEGQHSLQKSLKKQAEECGFILEEDKAEENEEGAFLIKMISPKNGEQMSDSEYKKLSEEEKEDIKERQRKMQGYMQNMLQGVINLGKETKLAINKLERTSIESVINSILEDLEREYAGSPKVIDYLKKLREYVLSNINFFKPKEETEDDGVPPILQKKMEQITESHFLPFSVNLFVDNSGKNTIPIIVDNNPSFGNLFGKIEKRLTADSLMDGLVVDHTCLKAGSLCQANGGCLVLDVRDILEQTVWRKLKKTLQENALKIEDPFGFLGLTSSLDPEPLPLDLKVIVVGEPFIYHLLAEYDPDFLTLFKIKAEFDPELKITPKALADYAGFIAAYCRQKDLLNFSPAGVAKIVEYSARLAGSQTKLSTHFDKIEALLAEASYLAWEPIITESPSATFLVEPKHVVQAIKAQRSRSNLVEEKSRELIKDDILLIDTQGEKEGQINGLTVSKYGDYYFGRPIRITAKTFAGKLGLVSIQREVKLSGPIHNAGILIMRGYFGEKYGKYNPISFSASICFEQSYGQIDGDSASAAELICLISSLAGVKIRQDLAMTGSVNQNGEIQPIGGVNEKIEGFFDICQERGLTGEQGVIIPHRNIKDLMLREDVVEAVKSGMFSVYFIKTIDDGIELLMKETADKVHRKVRRRLLRMSKSQKMLSPNDPRNGDEDE